MSMDSPTLFLNTSQVLLNLVNPQSDSSPFHSSPFDEAKLEVNELIQAINNKTKEYQTRDFAELLLTKKYLKIAYSTFWGKPLAWLYTSKHVNGLRGCQLTSR